MRIYGIGGLGADKRVFEFLKLEHEFVPLEWIKHSSSESIQDYSRRLSKAIDTNSEFAILGVSFGGLIAVELSKILNPKQIILISSVETHNELRPVLKGLGKMGIVKLLPTRVFDPPRRIAQFVFGSENHQLLNDILDDTDLNFAKWAVNQLIIWKNDKRLEHVLRIHGDNDKLLPWNGDEPVELIKDGGHFMIVDRAQEISELINRRFSS